MTQQMHSDGEENRYQDLSSFTERSREHDPSFYELSGQKITQKRSSPIPAWRLVLAIISTFLIAWLSYAIQSGFDDSTDPAVMEGQLIGLALAVASITVINIVFNLKRFGQRTDLKVTTPSFSPIWRLVLAIVSILPVVLLTYTILESFLYTPKPIENILAALAMAIAGITIINIVFNLQR